MQPASSKYSIDESQLVVLGDEALPQVLVTVCRRIAAVSRPVSQSVVSRFPGPRSRGELERISVAASAATSHGRYTPAVVRPLAPYSVVAVTSVRYVVARHVLGDVVQLTAQLLRVRPVYTW